MKKWIWTAVIILIIVGIYIASIGAYGTWVNTNPQPGNIFSGDIKIEKIKNEEGAQHKYLMIISDKDNHALSCTPTDEEEIYTCLPFIKSPNKMTSASTIKDMAIQTAMTPLHLRMKAQNYIFYHVLDIEMSYVTTECEKIGQEGCQLIKLPQYTKKGI